MNGLRRLIQSFFQGSGPGSVDNGYRAKIFRGRRPLNDEIFDFLRSRIEGEWLDIGTNVGVLLQEVAQGVGVEASSSLVKVCQEKGLKVVQASACELPFESNQFQTVVLSCVLEQIADWRLALTEAIRVCRPGGKVIGFNPIPEVTRWGKKGGWVKSVIPESDLKSWNASFDYSIEGKYFFEITKVT